MIKSMTGYGKSEATFQHYTIAVELSSLNSRYFDYSLHIPRPFLFLEDTIKKALQQHISRGRVEIHVTIDGLVDEPSGISVNHIVAKHYYDALQELQNTYQLDSPITAVELARFPDVLILKKNTDSTLVEQCSQDILSVLEQAILDFNGMRHQEGAHLREDLLQRSQTIAQLLALIQTQSPHTWKDYRKKLEKRMADVLSTTDIDPNRILAEASLFADKIAVTEELTRINSHLKKLQLLLSEETAVGRKLDFIIQELGRETNTIGAKCNDVQIAHWVVDIKAELEKIREQIQNIE